MEFPRSQTLRLDSDALVAEELEKRRTRFRVLVCINGRDSSYEGLKLAAELGRKNRRQYDASGQAEGIF